jgi:multiple sugar transport system permease protein
MTRIAPLDASTPPSPHATLRRAMRSEAAWGLLLCGPWLIGFVTLILFPFAASFYWSCCDYDLLATPRWIGLANYRELAADMIDGGPARQALLNTLYYTLASVLLSVILGLCLAIALSWPVRGRGLMRTICYLPAVVPAVAVAIVWIELLDPQQGMLNAGLRMLRLPTQNWLQSPSALAWPSTWPADHGGQLAGSKDGLVLMSLWGVGNLAVIYLAAIGEVPRSLYEAAQIDGAGRVRRLWHVTLPMLSPVIFFNVVMGLIQAVQSFTQIYLASDGQGDPAGSAMTLSLYLFLTAFRDLRMGYASAIAWLLFVVVLLVTWALFRTSRHWVHLPEATP